MSQKTKTREITIVDKAGTFQTFFRKMAGEKEYDFEGISLLRKLLSNERAKLIHIIKLKNPGSIYETAKLLKRDFKSVSDDIKLLERFGFLELIKESSKGRERIRPILVTDSINILIKF